MHQNKPLVVELFSSISTLFFALVSKDSASSAMVEMLPSSKQGFVASQGTWDILPTVLTWALLLTWFNFNPSMDE